MEYNTLIVVEEKLYPLMEVYRAILEKSEFGTQMEHARFVSEDSVGDLPSTEWAHITCCIYLYGWISQTVYQDCYHGIEQLRKAHQNTNFYLLFCQDRFNEPPYGNSEKIEGNLVLPTQSIGIIEETDFSASATKADSLKEDLRIFKLLAVAQAIYRHHHDHDQTRFQYTYMTANVHLRYQSFYEAVIYQLNEYSVQTRKKEQLIAGKREAIEILKTEKPRLCKGKFAPEVTFFEGVDLQDYSRRDSMEKLRRDMEITYDGCREAMQKNIENKIHVARCALAIAEEQEPVRYLYDEHGNVETVTNDTDARCSDYMDSHKADPKDCPRPVDLLTRPSREETFNDACLRSSLPLARELENRDRPKASKTLLASLVFSLMFLVCAAGVYLARYLRNGGFRGVTFGDLMIVLLTPLVSLLLTGLIGFVIYWIEYLQSRRIFKEMHRALKDFIAEAKKMCVKIGEYVNRYLTVSYNYHIRDGRIESLQGEIEVLENEIEQIKHEIKPWNDMAQKITVMSGKPNLPMPSDVTDSDGKLKKTIKEAIIEDILANDQTDFSGAMGSDASNPHTHCHWIERLIYGMGNINSKGENQ